MKTSSPRFRRPACRSGAALIVALTFVVLLTVIIVAFLLHAQISSQVINARAAGAQVDVMARTAIALTEGDLRQEMEAGSTNNASIYTVNGIPAFIPSSNMTVAPYRSGFTPGAAGSDPMDNIVKISKSGADFYAGPNYNSAYPAPNFASAVSTGTPSLNGRHIDSPTTGWTVSGWNKPQLVDTTRYGTSALSSIPVPDWIYVTTTGRQILTQPVKNVVGRYAYVIYDEGGLLDLNVAGYPSSAATPDARDPARKGPLALADLTQIPGNITSTMQDAIVKWRNQATSTLGTFSSLNYPTSAAPDFLKYVLNGSVNQGNIPIYPGDQKFLSRQELLDYSAANPGTLPAQSLAYLGTFTRELNAPTWTPAASAPSTAYPNGFPYPSYAERNPFPATWTYNVDSANCRWTSTFTVTRPKLDADVDASATSVPTETVTFTQGEPVLQHRFPLSKIALLSNVNAQTQNPSVVGSIAWAVKYYFGLQWVATDTVISTPHWEYVNVASGTSADASEIRSIPDAAAQKREPDFFEMLHQGTLRGSAQAYMTWEMGASIIDQFDADDVPTAISAGTLREAYGKENIPYFSEMLFWPYRPPSTILDPYCTTFEAYLIPMFWNPHRNASTVSSTITKFQMILVPSGATTPAAQINGTGGKPVPGQGPSIYLNQYTTSGITAAAPLLFNTSSTTTYQEPTILSGGNAVPPGGVGITKTNDRSGFYLGSVDAPDLVVTQLMGGTGTNMSTMKKATVVGNINLRMECQSGGVWYQYEDIGLSEGNSSVAGEGYTATDTAGATTTSGTVLASAPSFSALTSGNALTYYGAAASGPVDPRVSAGENFGSTPGTDGGIGGNTIFPTNFAGTWIPNPTSNPNGIAGSATVTSNYFAFFLNNTEKLTITPSSPLYLGLWSLNNSSLATDYVDYCTISKGITGDNVQRPGDGVYGAQPMKSLNIQDRPIILNRPFRSVGELGYAYRGIEWKTIDFSSAVSGDAGLLDMFSLGESNKLTANLPLTTPPTYTSTPLSAGVVNINTRHPEVLQSLLSGSLKNDLDTSAADVISPAQATAIADAIVAETSSSVAGHGPLINRSELVTRLMGLSAIQAQLLPTVAKPEREAVVRALAEPANTRTWNLLVDLDVQLGHYPPSAIAAGSSTALAQFAVQGERRYWLHLAIDRYTGKVIDDQLEVVNDN